MLERETSPPAARRLPAQQRSRERVEGMLAAADLTDRSGSASLRMGEVAERAGAPIGSLCSLLPDTSALIPTLAERCDVMGCAGLEAELAGVHGAGTPGDAASRLLDAYDYALSLTEPVMPTSDPPPRPTTAFARSTSTTVARPLGSRPALRSGSTPTPTRARSPRDRWTS